MSAPAVPGPNPPDRDDVTAVMVLLRQLAGGDPGPPDPEALAHARAVLAPLVQAARLASGTDDALRGLLRWAQALGGPALTALLDRPTPSTAEEEAAYTFLELLDLMAEAGPGTPGPPGTGPAAAGPAVMVEAVDGYGVVTTVRADTGDPWCAPLADADRVATAAVSAVLDVVGVEWPGPSPDAPPRPTTVRWPPGAAVRASGAALPLALWHLGRVTGLAGPGPGGPGLLVAGDIVDGRCPPTDEAQVARLRAATATAGLDLLVPSSTGWQRYPAAPRQDPAPVDGALTLDGAATAIWGEEWAAWKRRAHADALDRLGWRLTDLTVPAHQPVPDRLVRQVDQLEVHLVESNGRTAVLGGPPGSGRSAIVRMLARRLAARRKPWLVRVVTGPNGDLPSAEVAVAVARHALGSAGSGSPHRLVVLEDLQPVGSGDAAAVLRRIAHDAGTAVLGVLHFDENSPVEWDTKSMYVVTAVVSAVARRRFVEDLAAADPALDAGRALAAFDDGRSPDLRELTELMCGADPAERRTARFDELDELARAQLLRLAAVSLAFGDVAAEDAAALAEADRALFGVCPGRHPGRLRLASTTDAMALVQRHGTDGAATPGQAPRRRRPVLDVLTELLAGPLAAVLAVPTGAAADLLVGARLHHSDLCRRLLREAAERRDLFDWAATAPPTAVMRVVGLAEFMTEPVARELAELLVHRLPRETPEWRPSEVLVLLRGLQDVAFFLDSDVLEEAMHWFAQVTDEAVFLARGRPRERLDLLQALERFHRDQVNDVLTERTLDVLAGLTVERVEDYRLVRDVDDLQHRLANRVPGAGLFHVDQEHPVQVLLTHVPDRDDGIGVLLESMNLRSQFGADWDEMFPQFELALNASLRFAGAADLATALNEVRTARPPLITWLLSHWTDLPAHGRDLLGKASAADAAMLVGAVARGNLWTAGQMLEDRIGDRIAARLARRAADSGDGKGIGLLLTAARGVDDAFRVRSSSFAHDVAEALGEGTVRELIEDDPRTSVRYHLIKGIWDAEAGYREDLLESVLDIVERSVRRRRNHWGAEIALRIASDLLLGPAALAGLRRRLPPEILLRGMIDLPTAHGRAIFHRLGRALHPDVPARFLAEWELQPFVEGLVNVSPAAALEVCTETASTLAEAGLPRPGRVIADATGGVERWARRLAHGRRQDTFADAITRLSALDAECAGGVLDALRARPGHLTINRRPADVLLARVRHAFLDGPETGPRLLGAVRRVRPGLAADLLAEVTQDRYTMYVFRGEIQQHQDIVGQSGAARELVRCGMTLGSPGAGWIDSVFKTRIPLVERVAGPRGAAALVRMLSAWNEEWGASAGRRLAVPRIGRRVRHAFASDLQPAVDLVGVLTAIGLPEQALRLCGDLLSAGAADVVEKLPLRDGSRLLDVLGFLDSPLTPRVARALREALDTRIRQPVWWDAKAQLVDVGRAARAVGALSVPVVPPGEPPVPPNVVHAAVLVWAATGLGRPGWGNDALDRAGQRLAQGDLVLDDTDRACLLAAAGPDSGVSLPADATDWSVGRAPLWLLRHLYVRAADTAVLAPVLEREGPALLERVRRPAARADWDAYRLRLALEARGVTVPTAAARPGPGGTRP